MSSQRRIDSSRANGARSRGPKTPQGLARCQDAPCTHGVTARNVILDGESEDEFRALLNSYLVHFRPRSPREVDLVTTVVSARWRLSRLTAFETELHNSAIARQDPGLPPDHRMALAWRALSDESNVLENLQRHAAHLNRIYCSALEELEEIEKCKRVPVPKMDTPPHGLSTNYDARTPLQTKSATGSQSRK